MRRPLASIALALALAGVAGVAHAGELERLRAENVRLQSQLEAARAACPAAGTPAPEALAPSPPAIGSLPLKPASAPEPLPSARTPAARANAAPASSTAGSIAPVATAPRGYHLAPDVLPEAKAPYKNTGCDQGLLKGPAPGKWRDDEAWKPMQAGLSMEEVEAMLGVEHYDVDKNGVLEWHYGQCGFTAEAVVRFKLGRVEAWKAPD